MVISSQASPAANPAFHTVESIQESIRSRIWLFLRGLFFGGSGSCTLGFSPLTR